MKWHQLFFILAAVYLSPRVSEITAIIIAGIFTLTGLALMWRRE